MSRSESPGSWAAAVGGGAAGAVLGGGAVALSKAQRGVKGLLADGAHKQLDKLGSPEAIQKFAERHKTKIDSYFELVEKAAKNGNLDHLGEDGIRQVLGTIERFKEAKISEIHSDVWKEVHGTVKGAKEALEKVGLKKGLVASVPGGAATLVTVSGLIGAALSYIAIKGLHESARDGDRIER